jgi:hypothetical protein
MRTSRELIFGLGLAAVGLVAFAGAASAQVINTDVGLNDAFSQTSDSTATETGAFFSARVFFSGPGQYTTGTLTLPNSNTRPLADQGYLPPTYEIGYEDTAASLSDLEATYPTGTYTFDVSGGTQPEKVVSQSYAGDAYPNTPLVTNFSALQGLNAADAFTVDLNGMVVSPNATPDVNNIYFFIYNASTNAQVFSDAGPPTVTDFVIPGGTLAAGTSYYFNLVYDDRIVDTTGGDSPITLTQFYDIGTAGDFTTAVPEPSTWAMMLVGFVGLGYVGYRGSRKKSAAAVAG